MCEELTTSVSGAHRQRASPRAGSEHLGRSARPGSAWPRLADSLAASRAIGPERLAMVVARHLELGSLSRPFLRWLALEEDALALEVLRLQEPPPPPPQEPAATDLAPYSLASFALEARESRRRSSESLGGNSPQRVPRARAARALGRSLNAERILAFLLDESPEERLETDVRDALTPPEGSSSSSTESAAEGTTESLYTSPAVLLQAVEVASSRAPPEHLKRLERIREITLKLFAEK